MANNEAIVNVIRKITSDSGVPCKKTLQKIVFLIEAKRIDLGCDYGIHFYGPYSADLDYAIRELTDDGILNIAYTPMEHFISVIDEDFGASYDNRAIDSIISEFSKDSPSELELIATALYVYLGVHDVGRIKDDVIKIKGSKYSVPKIDDAIKRLQVTGYITA
ncbi:MAG: hypothetical protein RR389_06155 [Christensenella sp.]